MMESPANDKQSPDSQNTEQNVTMSLGQAIEVGQAFHRSGRWDEAADVYRQILNLKPGQPEALHFLGVLLLQIGQQEEGEKLILAALESNPGYIDAISNLGNLYQITERYDEAAKTYERAIELKPDFLDAHLNLATLFYQCGRFEQAVAEWQLVMKLAPGLSESDNTAGSDDPKQGNGVVSLETSEGDSFKIRIYDSMANSFMRLGRIDQAVEFFHRWQSLDPDNPKPRHHIAALTGQNVPARAPDDYVQKVFDSFASSFDSQLQKLNYSAPDYAIEAVNREFGDAINLSVLDAGCGTGLCAEGIRPFAKRLTGVDLSSKMLELARGRGLYDELIEAELTEYLSRCSQLFDLIVSTDVLIYFGELFDVMTAANSALRPGGRFILSVESAAEEDVPNGFHLQSHGRYRHTKSYLMASLQQAGFKVNSLSEIFLRNENDVRVMGWLAVGQRLGRTTHS